MSKSQQLKSIVERIERLEDERRDLGGDIREIYSEAKGNGYEPKIIRMIVRLRRMNSADRAEQEALLETYWDALEGTNPLPLLKHAGVENPQGDSHETT